MNPHDLLVSFDENSMAFRTPLQRSFADAISIHSTSSLPSAIEYDEENDDYNDDDIHSAISAERVHHPVTSQNTIKASVTSNIDDAHNTDNDNDFHGNRELENINNNNKNNKHYHFKQESRDVFADSQLGNDVDKCDKDNDNININSYVKTVHKDCSIQVSKELPQSHQPPLEEMESPPQQQWSVAKIQTDPAMALSALQHERAQRIIAEQQLKLFLPVNTANSELANKHHSNDEIDINKNSKPENNTAVVLDAATLQVLSKQIVQCHEEVNSLVSELINNYKTSYKSNPSTSASSSSSGCSNTSTPFTSALTSNTLLRWLLDEMIRRLSSTSCSSNKRDSVENDVVSVDDSNVSQDSNHKWDHVPVLVTSRSKHKEYGTDNINNNNNNNSNNNVVHGNNSANNSTDYSKDNSNNNNNSSSNNNNNCSKKQSQVEEEEHSSYTDTVIHQTDYDGRQRR